MGAIRRWLGLEPPAPVMMVPINCRGGYTWEDKTQVGETSDDLSAEDIAAGHAREERIEREDVDGGPEESPEPMIPSETHIQRIRRLKMESDERMFLESRDVIRQEILGGIDRELKTNDVQKVMDHLRVYDQTDLMVLIMNSDFTPSKKLRLTSLVMDK